MDFITEAEVKTYRADQESIKALAADRFEDVTPRHFVSICKSYDEYYQYSDDARVWRAAERNNQIIKDVLAAHAGNPLYEHIYKVTALKQDGKPLDQNLHEPFFDSWKTKALVEFYDAGFDNTHYLLAKRFTECVAILNGYANTILGTNTVANGKEPRHITVDGKRRNFKTLLLPEHVQDAVTFFTRHLDRTSTFYPDGHVRINVYEDEVSKREVCNYSFGKLTSESARLVNDTDVGSAFFFGFQETIRVVV